MRNDYKTIHPNRHKPGNQNSHCARDKSLTHRAIIFSSLAEGVSEINFPLLGADCISTMTCFKKLGVQFDTIGNKITVRSPGWRQFTKQHQNLDCGNSGTTARLLTGLLASLPQISCTLTGDRSLSRRPMGRVVKPLRNMGAKISGPNDGETLPITIEGTQLKEGSHIIDKATAQVKSAILLAGLNIPGTTTVQLPGGSRDHTENILKALGADCERSLTDGQETVWIKGCFQPPPHEYTIPVDPSSAAFFSVFGLLRKSGIATIENVLNNPTRIGYLRVLERMSQKITSRSSKNSDVFIEPTIDIEVEGSFPVVGVEISEQEIPTLVDEVPILAILAAFAKSPSTFRGLSELRVKESDRLAKTLELLTMAGCEAEVIMDDLFIKGGLSQSKVFTYDSVGDHRLAMAAAILAKFADGPCRVLDADCVNVSFPNFYEELEKFEL